MRLRDTLLTAIAPALWGTTYIVTTQLVPPDRPLFISLVRALPIGLVMLAFARRLPSGTWWMRSGILGVLNYTLFFPLLFLAAYRLPGGIAATFIALQPVFVAALAWPLLGLRPTLLLIAAGFGAVFGTELIVHNAKIALDPIGVGAGLGGAMIFALATVLLRRWRSEDDQIALTAWQLCIGGALLIIPALALEGLPGTLTAPNLAGYAYLSITTAISYVLWFRGIGRLGVIAVAFLALLSPTTAFILGLAVRHETLTAVQLSGLLLVLGCIVVVQISSARPAAPR